MHLWISVFFIAYLAGALFQHLWSADEPMVVWFFDLWGGAGQHNKYLVEVEVFIWRMASITPWPVIQQTCPAGVRHSAQSDCIFSIESFINHLIIWWHFFGSATAAIMEGWDIFNLKLETNDLFGSFTAWSVLAWNMDDADPLDNIPVVAAPKSKPRETKPWYARGCKQAVQRALSRSQSGLSSSSKKSRSIRDIDVPWLGLAPFPYFATGSFVEL